jgi:uncharacterized protein YndB with AHSA1/START domain
MADYSFLSIWAFEAPIERVWAEISQPEGYAKWFPHISESTRITTGDEDGVGAETRSLWRTSLPYGFVIDTRSTRVERPHLLELAATGELAGTGRWELSQDGPVTTVRYEWNVRTNKAWMDRMAPLARPGFAWNHAVIMRAGGEGLAARLGARLVRNQSYTEESASPVGALTTIGGLFALGLLGLRLLGRIFSRD